MEATFSKKTASEMADEAIKSMRQMKFAQNFKPQKKFIEIRHVWVASAFAIAFLVVFLSYGILMSSFFPKYTVCGTITTKTGPMKNVSVVFQCPKSKKIYSQKTDENGRYRIEAARGTFKVAVVGDDAIPSRYMYPAKSPLKADIFRNLTLDFSVSDK
jgi:hypothetical protein